MSTLPCADSTYIFTAVNRSVIPPFASDSLRMFMAPAVLVSRIIFFLVFINSHLGRRIGI